MKRIGVFLNHLIRQTKKASYWRAIAPILVVGSLAGCVSRTVVHSESSHKAMEKLAVKLIADSKFGNWRSNRELRTPASSETPNGAPSWIAKSNALFNEFNLDLATIFPEAGAQLGAFQFDKEATHLVDDEESKLRAWSDKWRIRFAKLLEDTTDPEFREDIQLLLKQVTPDPILTKYDQGNISRYYDQFGPKKLIGTLLGVLFFPDNPLQRKKDAIERFHRYVRGYGDAKPILDAQRSRIEYLLARPEPKEKLFPAKGDLEDDLKTTDSMLDVLRAYLVNSGITGWEVDYDEFTKQVHSFNQYLSDRLMPLARTGDGLPTWYYHVLLQSNGIDETPEELIKMGEKDYQELYPQFLRLAGLVAQRNQLPASDPPTIMAFLRQKRVTSKNDVLALYTRVNDEIAALIRKNDLISIPDDQMVIRIMTPKESAISPIPFLQPPQIIGNQGEKPMFLMPAAESGEVLDDFSYEAGAYSLLAHEGRPGHDLQIRALLDTSKVSNVRRSITWNSANLEGWGMYSEMELFPYFSPEAQMSGLQLRLLRILRMIMEPKAALGKTTREEIVRKIQMDLGYTEGWAKTEAWRYFKMTGQAPSYQYGYRKLQEIKARFKRSAGKRFSEKCFNDGYLRFGVIPIDDIGDRMVNSIKCN